MSAVDIPTKIRRILSSVKDRTWFGPVSDADDLTAILTYIDTQAARIAALEADRDHARAWATWWRDACEEEETGKPLGIAPAETGSDGWDVAPEYETCAACGRKSYHAPDGMQYVPSRHELYCIDTCLDKIPTQSTSTAGGE